jgi:pilus assembly protein CpaE
LAITRARLAFRVPWRRGSGAPVEPAASIEGVAPAPAPFLWPSATPVPQPRDHRLPPRGPDGRFIRRAAAPESPSPVARVATPPSPVSATVALEAGRAEPPPQLVPGRWAPAAPAAAPPPPPVAGRWAPVAPNPEPPPLAPGRWDSTSLRPEPAVPVESERAAADRSIRIVLVEDVPEVATHVRDMLRSPSRFNLVRVVTDGRRAVDEIRELEPDVVMVDALLQGRVSGRDIAQRLRDAGSPVGIVALTVPTHTLDRALSAHADAVVTLPLGTIDLGRGISDAHAAAVARNPSAGSRVVAVFSAKGGVGKTTIAYNLAASLAHTGLRTLLIDGNLQFGDVRRLMRADPTAPSICDLPTDLVRGSDVADTVVQDPSGVDVLLAPPRPELADLVSARDIARVLDLLRRTYPAIVIDTPSSLSEPTLAFLDAADLIIDVLSADATTLELTRMMATTFAEVGYPEAKVRYLVNRFDTVGAAPVSQVARAIGRRPDHTVASDWQLVSASNAEGIPFVLARPGAAASADVQRLANDVRALAVAPHDPMVGRSRGRGAGLGPGRP